MIQALNPDGLVFSENYRQTMDGVVVPAINARRTNVTVKGAGGRPLFASRFDAEAPRGTVVIVHGFTENADKFDELIHSLLQNRFSVVACDQRGHGRSWRAEGLEKDLSLTHVDRFEEYVEDLNAVCEQVLKAMPGPWMLFAHSMGGAVSTMFLETHPGVFTRAALCAPMIAPARMGLPLPVAKLICAVPKAMGKGKKRMFFSKPYSGAEDFATSCAAERERFEWYEALRVATPEFQNNGPSCSWTLEALNVTRKLLAPGMPEKIAIPVRVYTAEDDGSVLPEAQEALVKRLRDGRRRVIPGSKHEIYRSPDDVLFPWWHEILDFFHED